MFKPESYITPIILNHVAKYVKNIRPQDAQVSLWEGEVAFQNLDLRLDVLEEELNLSFEFLSGHIHELSIRVPWTKITSDPIIITINTIEFVLKLKDTNADASTPSPRRSEQKKRQTKVEEAQQGYMPGLVNKIINNIVVNCHNIILKYVEEDIVVSMNVQYLSFASANEQWKPTFTDVNPMKLLMRKLIKISDLTICLDKRNSLGQIEVCQEPILYRCSLDVRIIRKQTGSSTITRMGIFTKLMEMNISSMQFPMVMRLIDLVLALKSGKFKTYSDIESVQDDAAEEAVSTENAGESYLDWAWNLLPAFTIDEPESQVESSSSNGNIFEIGMYLDTLNFTLKSSEFITDSIVGATKKIRYSPIFKCVLKGIFSETLSAEELNWSNTKTGVSEISIEPLGVYVDDVPELNAFVSMTAQNKTTSAFLDGSLFDEVENAHEKESFITDLETHNSQITDAYLFQRSPAWAFDMVCYKDKLIEADTFVSRSNEIAIEEDLLKCVMRVLAGSLTLRYSSAMMKVISVVQELISTYDYPPYLQDKTDIPNIPKLHPPLLDDFDSLMRDIPLKIIKFKLRQITVETFAKFDSENKHAKQFPPSIRQQIPHFVLHFESIEGSHARPIDVNKLVHTTCQLPEKPVELMAACYDNLKIHLYNVTTQIKDLKGSCALLRIPEVTIEYGDLLLPDLWKDDEITVRKFNLIVDNFNIEFTKQQVLIASCLSQAVSADNLHALHKISLLNSKHSMHQPMPRLETKLVGIKINCQRFKKTLLVKGILCSLECHMIAAGSVSSPDNLLLVAPQTPTPVPWLEWHSEIPNDFSSISRNSVLSVSIENYAIALNSETLEFFKHRDFAHRFKRDVSIDADVSSSSRPPLMRRSSRKSIPSDRISRKISFPAETIHFSSDKEEKMDVESSLFVKSQPESSYNSLFDNLKTLLLHVDIDFGRMYLCRGDKYVMSSAGGCTKLTLPKILCKSTGAEKIQRLSAYNFILAKSVIKDTFPWTFNIIDFRIASQNRVLLHPVQTTITIAMNLKKELVNLRRDLPTSMSRKPSRKSLRQSFELKRSRGAGCISEHESDREGKKKPSRSTYSTAISRSSSPETADYGSEKVRKYIHEDFEPAAGTGAPGKSLVERAVVTLNLHIDTSPIAIESSIESMSSVCNDFKLLTDIFNYSETADGGSFKCEEPFRVITCFEDDPNIKEFMDFETNSGSSKPIQIDHPPPKLAASFLLQWTVTKFSISMEGPAPINKKLSFETEDVITTIDKREDFIKLTGKIGTFNLRHFELSPKGDWMSSNSLKIGMTAESTQSPFLNVIVTNVGLRNFFDRIGAKRKGDIHRSISEIVATMRAIEIIVDLEVLEGFMPLLDCIRSTQHKEVHSTTETAPLTVADLPMVHLKWKGCTIYFPLKNETDRCTAAIFKIEQIDLSSDLENPLQRTPIRNDVFNKAAQMGILHTPGSYIEDRQYELTLKHISAASGNWANIANHMKEYIDNSHNTNPAFEWNNQGRRTSMELREIFKNFTFTAIYAPCIAYNKVLICGPSIELNCYKDFICKLTNEQIGLIGRLALQLQKFQPKLPNKELKLEAQTSFESISEKSKSKKLQKKYSEISLPDTSQEQLRLPESTQPTKSDSGFHSIEKSKRKSRKSVIRDVKSLPALSSNLYERKVPYSISFLAGVFVFKFYSFIRKRHDEAESEDVTEPLILLTISQPNFIISQTIYEYSVQLSLFNLNVCLHRPEDDACSTVDEPPEFNLVLFDTKRGELNSAGIPPSLVTLKYQITKSRKLEMDVSMSKPAMLNTLNDTAENATRVFITLYESFLGASLLTGSAPQTISRGTKIQLVRNSMYNADQLNVNLKKLSVHFAKDDTFDVTMSLADLALVLKYSDRPEKLIIKGSVGALYLQTESKIILHPVAVDINAALTQESWYKLPLVTANLNFNVIQIELGVHRIKKFIKASNEFQRSLGLASDMWEELLERRAANYKDINRDKLEQLALPGARQKKTSKQLDEFYQDDLRAGAFQFVVMTSDDVLPMPYQIQIIKKNYGIICWRYPQPRKMRKVFIYPVPMAESAHPIEIKCRMEFYSEAHQAFLPFCDFCLSETDSKQIDLPQRNVTANIWRVVILQSLVSINGECFDTSEEDEEFNTISTIKLQSVLETAKEEEDFILHPKVLVGCMRIDTQFNPAIVPKVQILFSAYLLQLDLQNQQNANTDGVILPPLLKKYKLVESTHEQTFLSLVVAQTNVHASFLSLSNYQVQSDLMFSVKCLDYSYLNMLPLIEETNWNSVVSIADDVVDMNVVGDKLRLNIGSSMLHTLLTSWRYWNEFLDDSVRQKQLLLLRFVVINRLDCHISFGQTDTSERIQLQPQHCTTYSFRSDFFDQNLTLYAMNTKTGQMEQSNSIPITTEQKDEPHVHHAQIGSMCVVLKIKVLSTTQVAIIIKGQIELLSMVSTGFKLQFRKPTESNSGTMTAVHEYDLDPNGKVTFYQQVNRSTELTMRFRFRDTQSKGWTGDIPLKPNKSFPWLVKVPISGTDNFTSFWVRILRHDIETLATDTFQPQQILITIWPIFQIRSMLTCPLNAIEKASNEEFTISPNGNSHQLQLPVTHQTEHDITFTDEYLLSINEDNTHFNLSLKAIDWNRFFWYDESLWTVEKALTELGKSSFPKWPLADEDELRIKRVPAENSQTHPQFKCYPSRDFSCTLSLEVAPTATFINSTGLTVALRNYGGDDRTVVHSNEIAMLLSMSSALVIELPNGPNWQTSLPIYFDKADCSKTHESERYLLEKDCMVPIVVRREHFVHKLLLKSVEENGRRIFILKPAFVVTNFSANPLVVRHFCLEEREQTTRAAITAAGKCVETLLGNTTTKGNSKGSSLDTFYDLNAKSAKRSNTSTFCFFVSFAYKHGSELSLPILLSSAFSRKCFSLQIADKSISLTASLIIKDEIRYLSIFENRYAALEINNQTELAFVIGQTNASENSKVSSTVPEYEGKHFQWLQVLRPRSQLFYTPPAMYVNFPEVESVISNLALAIYNESPNASKTPKWSKAIQANCSTEKFLHIPLHGDVKIVICDKHRVTKISIFYFSKQLEFSVKDLRSRLSSPQNVDTPDRENLLQESGPSDVTLRKVRPTTTFHCMHNQEFDCDAPRAKAFKMRVFVKEINGNLFVNSKTTNYMTTEVFALYVDEFAIEFERPRLDVIMANLQIDNQLYSSGNYDFPVVLCSRELFHRSPVVPAPYTLNGYVNDLRENPLVMMSFKFYDDELELQTIDCKLNPIRAYIEDTYLNDLFDHLLEWEPTSLVFSASVSEGREELGSGQALIPKDIVNQAQYLAEILKLRTVRIDTMSVLLSVHTCVRMYIALDHSPLEFSAYDKNNILTLPLSFGHAIGMHYLSGALFGAGWVVGSLEILGSPSGLARSVSTGLKDFVSMPVQGLLRGPWGFVVGMTQGSASLLRNVTAGTVNSVTKLAASVARNLDRLTLDAEHIQRTEALRRSRPQGITEGFAQGLTGLGISILGAVGGIARHTLEARSPVQVVTGVGKGIVGAFAKPISGAAELVALTGQGVLHTVGFNAMPRQRAPSTPRNMAIHPSDSKIWKLLPQVLATDQILYFQEGTLLTANNQLKLVAVVLTASVLAVISMEHDRIDYVVPINKLEASIDPSDRTLISVTVKQDLDEYGEDLNFTNQRIMNFLRSSGTQNDRSEITTESLEDLLKQTEKNRLNWSFYISENLGQYLLQYLKIIQSRTD